MNYYWRIRDEVHGPFPSRVEAECAAEQAIVPPCTVMIGEILEGAELIKEIVGVGYADGLLDALGEQAAELCGEAADDWPYPGYKDPARAALDNMLEPVLTEWIEQCSPPSFWRAKVETEVEVHFL